MVVVRCAADAGEPFAHRVANHMDVCTTAGWVFGSNATYHHHPASRLNDHNSRSNHRDGEWIISLE